MLSSLRYEEGVCEDPLGVDERARAHTALVVFDDGLPAPALLIRDRAVHETSNA